MEYRVLLRKEDCALLEANMQYIVACGYDETKPKGQQWNYGLYFMYHNTKENALYKAIETFRERTEDNYILRNRLEKLAMLFKNGLIEDDKESAMEYFNGACEMIEEEKEWFGIDENMKITVLDRRTSNNHSADNFGDFVYCCNCGRTILVDLGTQKCPECGGEETFMWADENNQEVDEDFFSENKDYILADKEEMKNDDTKGMCGSMEDSNQML